MAFCNICGTEIDRSMKRCPKCGDRKRYTGLIIFVLCIIVLTGGAMGVYLKDPQIIETISNKISNVNLLDDEFSKLKKKVLTEENKQAIFDEAEVILKENDEIYYLTCIALSYIFNENGMYGKTVGELIEEGKTKMKDDNLTLEEFKKQIEDLQNSAQEFNNSVEEFNSR